MRNVLSSAIQLSLCIAGVALVCVSKYELAMLVGWMLLTTGAVLILRYARASAREEMVEREKFSNVKFEERKHNDDNSGPWSN